MIKKIENYLIKTGSNFVILIFVIFIFLISILYNILLQLFTIKSKVDSIQFYDSILEIFIFAVVLAPVIETFIFLYLFFHFLKTKLNSRYIIFLSALCFSLIHFPKNFSVTETLNVFIVGLILAYAYKIFSYKNKPAFWYVVAIHAFINLIGIMTHFFLPEVSS
ncbi:CAAX protease self-immunity [Algoriphagus faecimaris]|uniref:CAAX protease self-immunity n=1 Tax=Algoriphagus faecimaris TaxID=686796 RepID=A0A1G6MU04_9BACT|nr:CPBP family intramembrane glutamic endopeptidase [Algoriphagus faecimaris]SDC59078.1 CAAX protease self-immunity [Algoriphagus faecimaris]